jgi:3-deoxy-D-manno-octulosonate 8-phosphate phosphatase (KDO 8-P phosphatase)
MIKKSKNKKLKLPSLLVFDFDGVLTNNKVIVRQDGTESVICCRSDGLGMEMARKSGLRMLILSKEINPVVSARGKKLKVEVIQAIDDKPKALMAYCKKHKIKLSDVLYVGNDLNDAAVMKIVGQSACPKDSHPLIKKIATLILNNDGGNGAVRELIEDRLGINTYI